MEAVILAAGKGSRLRPLTIDRPKAAISVDGTPILEHQLRAYDAADFESVHVVAGYMADSIRRLCDRVESELGLEIDVIENPAFANTDNMHSLYCAREAVAGEPFVLGNGDVVFDPHIVDRLAETSTESGIAAADVYQEEAMKITVDRDGYVDGISKEFDPETAEATSIDLYRFSAETSGKLFERISTRIEVEDDYSGWTEVALDELLRCGNHDVKPIDISGSRWVEIDDRSDLLAADRTFSSLGDLRSKDAIFFDLDGTIYLDDVLIDGADRLVRQLREAGVDVYFLSNNSSRWKSAYADKLSTLGIRADSQDVILSTDGVIDYLVENGIDRTYVVGTDAMREAIRSRGIEVEAPDPETVVVGFDTELTYEKVAEATLAIRGGAEFVLAHGDAVCPTSAGFVPDCGSIGALVETASNRSPSRVFGKPNPGMVDHVIDREGYDPEDIVIVGDRLATDIQLADRLGCESVCVLSGDTTRRAIETAEERPTLVVEDVGDLLPKQVLDDAAPPHETTSET